MSQARWIERAVYPYAVLLQTVPILALVPLFGFWFGFGLPSRDDLHFIGMAKPLPDPRVTDAELPSAPPRR